MVAIMAADYVNTIPGCNTMEVSGGRWMILKCWDDLLLPEQKVDEGDSKLYQTVLIKLSIKLIQFIKFFINSSNKSK